MDHLEEKRLSWQNRIFSDHPKAKAEKSYPGFHLASPAHFLFDYWGAYKRNGYYHIFFDVCVDPADNEHTIYGHARSRDLLHWEYLPMPIAPLDSELRMNDGFICENGKGEPIMLYTSVPEDGSIPRVHVAAVGTPDLMHFQRMPEGDPFMTLENHGGPDFGGGWSDPWLFDLNRRTYMLMSKCVCRDDGSEPMPVYEATDDTMLHWEYRGNLFDHNGEVVNFFPMGDKWVLIYSPYNSIEYFVGDLDPKTLRFTPEQQGILSYGYHSQSNPADRGFYATCVYPDEQIICGWISGFVDAESWNGCMGIPRKLGLNNKLQLTQQPIPETDILHGKLLANCRNCTVSDLNTELGSHTLDIQLCCSTDSSLTLLLGDDRSDGLTLELNPDSFAVNGEHYPVSPFGDQTQKALRILVDKSFAEIFLGDGAVCATRCFHTLGDCTTLKLRSSQPIRIHQLDVWDMKAAQITYHPDVTCF